MPKDTQSRRQALTLRIAFLTVVSLALFLRLFGVSWDGGYLFHPDERKILMVVDELSLPWPPDWAELLTPESPWNPEFFAYGSLPLYLLRYCADIAGWFDPAFATLESSYVIGRVLSALFDVGTVCLVYGLGRKLYGPRAGILASALVAVTVLHIQLAHFYAVDTLLTFFVVAAVSLAVDVAQRPRRRHILALGVACGLALATKVSSAPLLLSVSVGWVFGVTRRAKSRALGEPSRVSTFRTRSGAWVLAFVWTTMTGVVAAITFLICEPYALLDVVTFVVDILHESQMARGIIDIPYTRQYIGTLPYLYALWQAMLWSMGIPLGIAGYASLLAMCVRLVYVAIRRNVGRLGETLVPLSWVAVYFGLVGSFHAKFLRYLLPVIPFLCLWAAWGLDRLLILGAKRAFVRVIAVTAVVVVLGGSALYAAAYMHIYQKDHTWIQATAWLCDALPDRSVIMIEHWDDPLPLWQGTGALDCSDDHSWAVFHAYDPDDTAKLGDLLFALERSDVIVLSSNRLYNTIPRLPQRYPLATRYYNLLMGERLGYELVYYAAVYPQLGGVRLVNDTFSNPDLPKPKLLATAEAAQINLNLGRADESFTVYDHPKPMVFLKTKQLSRDEFLTLFGDAAVDLPPPESDSPE